MNHTHLSIKPQDGGKTLLLEVFEDGIAGKLLIQNMLIDRRQVNKITISIDESDSLRISIFKRESEDII